MAMEEEEEEEKKKKTELSAANPPADSKKGGDGGESGACIDKQPDMVVRQVGPSLTAGRGSRSGPGAHSATGIRVLKAGSESDRVRAVIMDFSKASSQCYVTPVIIRADWHSVRAGAET